jgi:Arc/MetJ-type ribon-helix-helix transcriptional regulator
MARTITVRIDDELEELLEAEQSRHPYEVPVSEIVRTALREHLDREGNGDLATATATN